MNNKIEISLTPLECNILDSQINDIVEYVQPRITDIDDLPEHDKELSIVWQDSLQDQLDADMMAFFRLLQDNTEGHGAFLCEADIMSVMRACAAMRLAIQESYLHDVSIEDLEMGKVDFASLAETKQNAYLCFALLSSVQEMLISKLQPAGTKK